jgi:hypothetical protein
MATVYRFTSDSVHALQLSGEDTPPKNPSRDQLIELTGLLVDDITKKPVAKQPVYFWVSLQDVNPEQVVFYSTKYSVTEGRAWQFDAWQADTDANGYAKILVGCSKKAIFTLYASASSKDVGKTVAQHDRTTLQLAVATATFTDGGSLPAPDGFTGLIDVEAVDGTQQYPDPQRRTTTTDPKQTMDSGSMMFWTVQGDDLGQRGKAIGGIGWYDGGWVTATIPYIDFKADDNRLLYFIYSGHVAHVSKVAKFDMGAPPMARPDDVTPHFDSQLKQPAFIANLDNVTINLNPDLLGNNDFDQGGLNFAIPDYPGRKDVDSIEIYAYLNGWSGKSDKTIMKSIVWQPEMKFTGKYYVPNYDGQKAWMPAQPQGLRALPEQSCRIAWIIKKTRHRQRPSQRQCCPLRSCWP